MTDQGNAPAERVREAQRLLFHMRPTYCRATCPGRWDGDEWIPSVHEALCVETSEWLGAAESADAANLKDEPQVSAPKAPSEALPEIERLKAELESVHEAWRQSIDSGNAGWKALSAAEQRAEAAEKETAQARKERERALATAEDYDAKVRAAEQRSGQADEALRDLFALVEEGLLVRNIGSDGEPGYTLKAMRVVLALKHAHTELKAARAALHDEERSAPPEVEDGK